ncbi:type IV pilin protein [Candidatus Avelusimicrobium luingense]|uniref:type IV pilin protein n=1 Tax=Candidatus Avelusimicrobium luingense TaxID=3416211 RepID=UPI003D0C0641
MQKERCLLGRLDTKAFTLIELLVVVLIIGILAAVALPQYQKAVWKSRNTQLKTAIKSVVQAQEAYFLANSTYATDFDELGIELAGDNTENPCTIATSGTPAGSIRGTKDYYLVLNVIPSFNWSEVIAVWKTGPYACAGFEYLLEGGSLEANTKDLFRCTEARHSGYDLQGKFCEKIEKGQATVLSGSWQRYSLP